MISGRSLPFTTAACPRLMREAGGSTRRTKFGKRVLIRQQTSRGSPTREHAFRSLIAELSKAAVQPHERPLLAQLLASQAPAEAAPVGIRGEAAEEPSEPRRPRPTPATRTPRAQETPPPSSAKTGTLTFDVPLRLTVSFADAPPAAVVPIPAKVGKARAELLEEALNVEDYADRDGYDRRFLGVKVPLPTMKQTPKFGSLLRVPRPARPADRFELRYHRFSILMNKERRLAYRIRLQSQLRSTSHREPR